MFTITITILLSLALGFLLTHLLLLLLAQDAFAFTLLACCVAALLTLVACLALLLFALLLLCAFACLALAFLFALAGFALAFPFALLQPAAAVVVVAKLRRRGVDRVSLRVRLRIGLVHAALGVDGFGCGLVIATVRDDDTAGDQKAGGAGNEQAGGRCFQHGVGVWLERPEHPSFMTCWRRFG